MERLLRMIVALEASHQTLDLLLLRGENRRPPWVKHTLAGRYEWTIH